MIDNDLTHCDPFLQSKVTVLLQTARNEGLHPYVFEGRRSLERQYALFGTGRTQAECRAYGVPVQYADPYSVYPFRKAKRTWTLASKHLQGKAVDIVFDSDPDPKVRVPSWSGNYARLIQIGNTVGLHNLAPREICHFEL